MARKYKVETDDLAVDTLMFVSGQVAYSAVAQVISGERLKQNNARRTSNRMQPIDRPHTTITITNPRLSSGCDPNSDIGTFLTERFYISTRNPQLGQQFSATNKTGNIPHFGVRANPEAREVEGLHPEGELAQGLDVTLCLRVFKTTQKNGINLEAIIINEKPVRYFNGTDNFFESMSKLGLTWSEPPEELVNIAPQDQEPTQRPSSPTPPPEFAQYNQQTDPFSANTPIVPQSPQQSGQPPQMGGSEQGGIKLY